MSGEDGGWYGNLKPQLAASATATRAEWMGMLSRRKSTPALSFPMHSDSFAEFWCIVVSINSFPFFRESIMITPPEYQKSEAINLPIHIASLNFFMSEEPESFHSWLWVFDAGSKWWTSVSSCVINLRLKNLGWLFGFYGISTFVGYLMPNPFLYK